MVVFWRLILAHFIADFTLQTNYIAMWKRKSRVGMLVHILTHPVTYAVLTWPFLGQTWVQARGFHLDGWACIGILTFFHWAEDEWRVWSILQTGSPDSTLFFLWDQVVHLVMILALTPTWPEARTETWVFVLLCAVLLAHFTSVLIYFLENDLWGHSAMMDHRKYFYIGERFIGASLFLLPGALFLLAMGWIGWVFYLHYHRHQERTWVHLVVSTCAVALLGLLARGFLLQS